MKTVKRLLFVLTITILTITACKKSSSSPGSNNTTQPKTSKLGLLSNDWILSETYENDVKKTSNGTGKYRFTSNGNFLMYNSSNQWENMGTYKFNDADSNSISVAFTGSTMSLWWTILVMDTKKLNVEFIVSGTKYDYNYTR